MLPDLIVRNRQTPELFAIRNYLPFLEVTLNGVQTLKTVTEKSKGVQTPHDLLKQ